MTDRKVVLYVCGIFTFPGAAKNWTSRAVRWTHANRPDVHAEKVEYFTDVLFRNAGQGPRARLLADALDAYEAAGYSISLVGHSNGADVILDALTMRRTEVEGVVLFAPACAADCDESGLNRIEARRVAIWGGSDDVALWGAGTLIGRWNGFGTLGRNGPSHYRNVAELDSRIIEGYSHTGFFDGPVFDGWMAEAMSVCFPDVKSL